MKMDTTEWLQKLISMDTTSYRSNLSLITEIQTYLDHHQALIRLTHNEDHLKANLFATLPAKDGTTTGGIILSGHTDVVPVEGQDWDSDPFTALQVDNKIYGRGSADMKGFLAASLALVPEFKQLSLPIPIHLAFSYDEEVGCIGAASMIADIIKARISPKACIVGEPTEMHPVVAHKGLHVFCCKVHGQSAHSSLTPEGCNAIEYAGKLISFLRNMADQFKQKGPFDSHFDVPFTTMSANIIHGGVALNIIPELCELVFEFRQLPEVNADEMTQQIQSYIQTLVHAMRQEYASASIECMQLANAPSFEADLNSKIRDIVIALCGEKTIQKVAYATEAGLFQGAQIPTIICGPGRIKEAHRANEFVELEQLKQCEDFLLKVVKKFSEN